MKPTGRKAAAGTTAALLALLALAAPAKAQHELPDAPEPKPDAATLARFDRRTHNFYDKTAKLELGANAVLFAADSAITCRNLANGWHEDFLPTQSCAGAVAVMAGEHAGQELLAWIFHKTNHHKLERVTRLYMTASHAIAITYSTTR